MGVIAGVAMIAATAGAQQVWVGYDVAFSKAARADWTLPENQDRITPKVWITRADTMGIFNIAQEDRYTRFLSPVDTEWAYGRAEDWESLTFQTWEVWAEGYPPGILDRDAVVHLISEDIYIDIRFTSWAVGLFGGGAFSYVRAAEPDQTCRPDCDENGRLEVRDFFCFQGKYAAGDMYADFDGNGRLDVRDFFAFQAAYAGGC